MTYIDSFEKFITGVAGPELLLVFGEDESPTVGELDDWIDAAPETISTRIRQAQQLELTERSWSLKTGDHGNTVRYTLTLDGKRIKRALQSLSYIQTTVSGDDAALEEIISDMVHWETEFHERSADDHTLGCKQTLEEMGFPGTHSYPNTLAFLEQNEAYEQHSVEYYIVEQTDSRTPTP